MYHPAKAGSPIALSRSPNTIDILAWAVSYVLS